MSDQQQQRLEGIQTVAVVGAGISGILATKYLLQAGLDVTVFERNEKPGGVWLVFMHQKLGDCIKADVVN